MKVTGVIAEFNPFHNGHAYFLRRAKEITGADHCVVVMSGDFVQRGAPAIADKYIRTQAALENGADLVLELPVLYATSSAETFAGGAVSVLNCLGAVDTLCFGCETENMALLEDLAAFLTEESCEYRQLLRQLLSEGLTYPAARSNALCRIFPGQEEKIPDLLSAPNNILALEYLKALKQQNSPITPVSVKRCGSGYHSDALIPPFASAGALRNLISVHSEDADLYDLLQPFVPDNILKQFKMGKPFPFLFENDISVSLHYRLLSRWSEQGSFTEYLDVGNELSAIISKKLFEYSDFTRFSNLCKTKDLTQARIRRALLHILLDLTRSDLEMADAAGHPAYVRMLGCKKSATDLLTTIKTNCRTHLIAKPAQAELLLTQEEKTLWHKDIYASHLYQMLLSDKYRIPMVHEYRRQICGLT